MTGVVTAIFDKEQLKGYDANDTKTYIFDEGDYYITAASDAHKAVNNIWCAIHWQQILTYRAKELADRW